MKLRKLSVCPKWGIWIKQRNRWSQGICKLIMQSLLKALMRKLGVFSTNLTCKERCLFLKKTEEHTQLNTNLWKEQIPFAKSQHLKHIQWDKSGIFRLQFVIPWIQFTKYCSVYHKRKNGVTHNNSGEAQGPPTKCSLWRKPLQML